MNKSKRSERFPLWKHRGTGQWCRKRAGRFFYFGADKAEAEKRYRAEWDDILAGRTPIAATSSLTVRELVNEFLTARRRHVESGELTGHAWGEYYATGAQIIDVLGKDRPVADLKPADFGRLRASVAKRFKPNTLAKFITITKTLFNFAYKAELIPVPVRYGNQFDKPARRAVRLRRAERGPLMVEPAVIWKLLDTADPTMRAVVLLGLNAGYGQRDCADLQRKALKVRPGWLSEVRRKTGIARAVCLWPETQDALAEAAKMRPEPAERADADCVFLTAAGQRLVRFNDHGPERRGTHLDTGGRMFRKLVKQAGVTWPGGFYTLRHVLATVASETKDSAAVDLVMGHHDGSMGGHYREKIGDDRLEAVAAHVRAWLLAGRVKEESPVVLPFKQAAAG